MTRGKGEARAPGEGVERWRRRASVGRGAGPRGGRQGAGGAKGRGAEGLTRATVPRTGGHRAGRFPNRAYHTSHSAITLHKP